MPIFQILCQSRTCIPRRQDHVNFFMDRVKTVAPSPRSLRRRPVYGHYFLTSPLDAGATATAALATTLCHLVITHVALRNIIDAQNVFGTGLEPIQCRADSGAPVGQLYYFFHFLRWILQLQEGMRMWVVYLTTPT